MNDPRVVPKQAALDRLLEAPEQDRDPALIQAAYEALMEAIAARETTRKGKRNGGSCGGDEDYRVDEAQAEREKLLNAPEIDEVAVKAARKKHKNAIEMQQKASKGKSEGGKKNGKKNGKYIPY